jgi:predicted phosphodiesterase
VERIVVVSDCHFGSRTSTLTLSDVAVSFLQELRGLGEIGEVILLGDLFDFWSATPDTAFLAAESFLNEISRIGARIVYVIGNHDHHAFISCLEDRFLQDAARGNIMPMDYTHESIFERGFLKGLVSSGTVYQVQYPRYWKTIQGKAFLFTHGHHLDPIGLPNLESVPRRFLRRIESKPIFLWDFRRAEDFEKELADSYEAAYRKAVMGEFITSEKGLRKFVGGAVNICSHMGLTHGPVPVQNEYQRILRLVESLNKKVSCFVYGHTHIPGAYRTDRLYGVNSGCWLKEPEPNRWQKLRSKIFKERPNTYLTIDDKITLRELGQPTPIVAPVSVSDLA